MARLTEAHAKALNKLQTEQAVRGQPLAVHGCGLRMQKEVGPELTFSVPGLDARVVRRVARKASANRIVASAGAKGEARSVPWHPVAFGRRPLLTSWSRVAKVGLLRSGEGVEVMGAFWIYAGISGFLGFCGFADCCVQPRQAWRNAGRSKPVWLLITFVGMITLVAGWITWALYSYGGTRHAVVRGGGYRRPQVGGINNEMRNRKFAGHVVDEINMRSAAPPIRPAGTTGSASPAAWFPDPTGRHGQRWWDGARWTEKVMDGNIPGLADPI